MKAKENEQKRPRGQLLGSGRGKRHPLRTQRRLCLMVAEDTPRPPPWRGRIVEQQTDNPYIYYDANNVRKARISTLLRDCLPAGRELTYVQLVEEIERLLGNKLWAEKILASIVQRGGLASRTDERGAVLYRMHGA